MNSTQRRIASHLLLTPQGFVKQPLLTVDGATRRILAIEQYDERLDMTAGVEFYSGIITAGFVNAHSHLELAYMRGAITEGCGQGSFASQMANRRNRFTAEERQAAIAAADNELWCEGVDAVADIVNDASSFAVKQQSLIHYRSFAEVFGLRQSNIEACRQLAGYNSTTLTPHSTYSIQSDDFESVCRAESDAPLSIHFMESADEALLYNGAGSLHEWYSQVGFQCDFLHYGSPARRIAQCVPCDRPLILVHNTYISEEDIDIILANRTAATYWVLCPQSNRYINRCTPRSIGLLRRKGCTICIGTDSLASNHRLSMVEELKCFGDVPLDELLRWATRNGAEAIGIGDRLGTVEVGRCVGLVALSGVDLSTMRLTDKSVATRIL